MQLPVYQQLNNALQSLDFGNRASELHGFLCGAVALDVSYPLETCISTLAPDLSHVVTSGELNDLLAEIYEVVCAQMTNPVLQVGTIVFGSAWVCVGVWQRESLQQDESF